MRLLDEPLGGGLERPRLERVVRVEEADHVAGRGGNSLVESIINSLVRSPDQTKFRAASDQLQGSVCRAAVDDDMLDLGPILTFNAA